MLYWIWLSRLKGYSAAKKRLMISEHGSPQSVYEVLRGKIPKEQESLEESKRILDVCERKKIFITPYTDYGIMDQPDLPVILYCRGEFRRGTDSVGIVGARRCSEYGKKMTESIAKQMALRNVTVVSGLAKGVDSYAHAATLDAAGYTIAVLGSGIDICYPPEHKALYEQIIEKGLVISEYSPGHPAGKETFPQRNRIIAAFSDVVVVTEAGRKSGALLTADDCLRYGKKLYAVPGRIDTSESEGCNHIISTGQADMYLPGCLDEEYRQFNLPGFLMGYERVDRNVKKERAVKQKQTRTDDHFSSESEASVKGKELVALLRNNSGTAFVSEAADLLEMNAPDFINLLTELEMDYIVRVEGEYIWLR